MSKLSSFSLSKTSAVLIGLSILVTSTGTAFAESPVEATTIKKSVQSDKAQQIQPKINIKNIENNIANMREKLASKESTLKVKLQTFRDQKKATVAARINTNLNQINQNQTTRMQKHLDTMSGILDKLEARIDQITPDILNPVVAKTLIAPVRETIASASAAVAEQSEKDYTIEVTTENKVRIDAKTMRDKLHTDILFIRKAVIDTKQAVANIIRVAKSGVAGENPEASEEGTISGQ
ncbi:hypothetical protein KKE78_01815 [Patescibacteria group bacterium]|nr:hypothetical protein [Patescibacteria group bacterium]